MEASISFCRAIRACHQSACVLFAASGHFGSASRGISHSCHCFATAELLAQRLQLGLPLLPDHVDLGVVGDGLQRDVGHPLVDEPLAHALVGRL
jgi:hypothetical protein